MHDWQALNPKRQLQGKTRELMRQCCLGSAQIGMIFYSDPAEANGWLVTEDDFMQVPLDQIGAWVEVELIDAIR